MPRPAARVLLLLDLLQSAGTRSRQELATELAVDERTVRRYVEHLRDLDIPVESVRGRYGGYRLAPGYRLPPLMLNDDEALAVLFALSESAAAAHSPGSQTAAATAIAKLRRALPERLVERAAVLQEAAVSAQGGAIDEQPNPGVLLTVGEAVRTCTPLDLSYVDRAGERPRRTVHPYELVVLQGRWYLIAYDTTRHATRTFRCDRILHARTARGHFKRPVTDPTDLAAEFASADYRYTVTLRVQAPIEQLNDWLSRTLATVEPGADGWQRVTIRAERLDWIPQRLVTIDAPIRIDGPPELRAVVTAAAARLAAMAG
ncbi:YafY family protein [Branchiibius sp. NY16-3462-2]|uniref:helix-turn-helix transcriptional regulator n=1 Tax=Branchiibius sp. NY16-3462-2 TaxID=1807500 RepID=UPI00079380BA|nr:YafY family protein [Branchiibius sp. NY16-3462-2]KYH45325.1 hypothetical protein AZH51_05475 [Branchiibius sp. NY16-3462-2]